MKFTRGEALNNISHPPKERLKAGPPLPALADWHPLEDLDDPGPGRGGRIIGQLVEREEAMGDDLMIGDRRRDLAEVRHHEYRHVIAAGDPLVKEDAVQPGWRRGLDIGLLAQLANKRIDQRLARLNPAPRQVPAAHVAVLNQKNAPLVIDHQGARPQRETAREPPINMQDTPNERLQRVANGPEGGLHSPIPICAISMP